MGVCNTCFVLGAGFSVPAGLAQQKDLLRNLFAPENATVLKHIQGIFGVDERDPILKDVLLEDVFTFLDQIITRNGHVGDFDMAAAHEAKLDIINYLIKDSMATLREMRNERKYEYFFNSIVRRKLRDNETNTIVTLNWDTIPDFYINRAFESHGHHNGVDYCCYDWNYNDWKTEKDLEYVPSILRKARGFKAIKIIKLHGSINWVYQKDDDVIKVKEQTGTYPDGLTIEGEHRKGYEHICMTPTFIKNLHSQHAQSIWQNAWLDLDAAKRIVFLGYAMPLADFEFRTLLLKTVGRKKDKKIRILIFKGSPEWKKSETRQYFKALFAGSKDIKFEEGDVADFLEDKEMIWNW